MMIVNTEVQRRDGEMAYDGLMSSSASQFFVEELGGLLCRLGADAVRFIYVK